MLLIRSGMVVQLEGVHSSRCPMPFLVPSDVGGKIILYFHGKLCMRISLIRKVIEDRKGVITMFKNLFKKPAKEQKLYAPLTGNVIPLEEVPDPVFSQKMMGEGMAIIPTNGQVLSPVNGKVIQIPESKHAIGLLSDDGAEVLIHVGLETVALKGEGFELKVETGEKVTVGQPLLEFDLEYIQNHAKDIVTPMVITNSNEGEKQFTLTDEKKANAGKTVIITVSE